MDADKQQQQPDTQLPTLPPAVSLPQPVVHPAVILSRVEYVDELFKLLAKDPSVVIDGGFVLPR